MLSRVIRVDGADELKPLPFSDLPCEQAINRFLVGHIQYIPMRGPNRGEMDYHREITRNLAYGFVRRSIPGHRTPYAYFRKTEAHSYQQWYINRYYRDHPNLEFDLGDFLRYFIFFQKGNY